ncbi:hypothetical protein M0L66_007286 [Pseudomonas aeruginosa]|nr:hypothetical protein [Pseudomonas aeruginosa]EKX5072392.1 hypothetical protein [Pseudomonas aeruginosa]
MRKRHPTDEIYQSIADRRSLKASRSTRRYNPNKATHAKRILDREVVPAPSSISFFGGENYKKFFEFLKKLYITSSRSKIIIDLQKTKEIKISAALILYATVEIIQKNKKRKTQLKQQYVGTLASPMDYNASASGNSRKKASIFEKISPWDLRFAQPLTKINRVVTHLNSGVQ